MVKRVALIAVLGAALMTSVLSAQAPETTQKAKPRLPLAGRLMRLQVRRGVKAGTITPTELAALRTEAQALRDKIQALRRNGQKPTPEQRQEIRRQLRQLRQDIRAAKRN
jgi:Spy/CpxP family protein refolding chaperone